MEISVSPYGKRALSLGVLNDEGRVTCQLYILENGNIHPDSWIRHEGRRPEETGDPNHIFSARFAAEVANESI